MSRYIDAREARRILLEDAAQQLRIDHIAEARGLKHAADCLDGIPTADVAPVIHAHWERLDFPKRKRDYYRCTNCGRVRSRDYDDEQPISEMLPFCNCGAKMDEEENKK